MTQLGFKMCQNLFALHYKRQPIKPFNGIVLILITLIPTQHFEDLYSI